MLEISEKSWEYDGTGIVTCLSLFGPKQRLGNSNWPISQPGIVRFSKFHLESCWTPVWHPGTPPNKQQLFSEHFSKIPYSVMTWSFSRMLPLTCHRPVWDHLASIYLSHRNSTKQPQSLWKYPI